MPSPEVFIAGLMSPYFEAGGPVIPAFYAPGGLKPGDVRMYAPTVAVRNRLIDELISDLQATRVPIDVSAAAARLSPELQARVRMQAAAQNLLSKQAGRAATLSALHRVALQGPQMYRVYEELAAAVRGARKRKSRFGIISGILRSIVPNINLEPFDR